MSEIVPVSKVSHQPKELETTIVSPDFLVLATAQRDIFATYILFPYMGYAYRNLTLIQQQSEKH